ncbi:AfsA-related hotdog domain-containing protein [Nocardia sp. NPDC059177]|uniref:AfsA-related hotdog domain-containing protein n=1 Tax=Nocardia sp. NPDC059177 TaxID=3346759 RepID=UPI0036BC4415
MTIDSSPVSTTPRTLGWPALPLAADGLSRRATVPTELAHKQCIEQVFVTDVALDDDHAVARAELPRQHLYYNDGGAGYYDTLLLAEVIRQAVEVMAHRVLNVPLSSQFVLRTVDVEVVDPGAVRAGRDVADVVVALPLRQVRRNGSGVPYAARGPVYCWVDGLPAVTFGGTVGFLASDTYTQLRSDSGAGSHRFPVGDARGVPPAMVGRVLPANVLIAEPAGEPSTLAATVVASASPVFFDRPLDHYPGMMLAEAARQLSVYALGLSGSAVADRVIVRRAVLEFVSFAELTGPVRCRVDSWSQCSDGTETVVVAEQDGRLRSRCRFVIDHVPLDN